MTKKFHNILDFQTINVVPILLIIATCFLLIISSEKLPFAVFTPGLPYLDTLAFIVPLIICVLLLIRDNEVKLDLIAIMLFFRVIFSLLTFQKNNISYYLASKSFLVFTTSLMSYVIWYSIAKNIETKKFSLFIKVFASILSIQTFGIYFRNYLEFGVVFKNAIEVPIGSSNFVAANLIVCVVYLLYVSNKNRVDTFVIGLSIVSLILTLSFGAIVSLFLILIVRYYMDMKDRSVTRRLFMFSLLITAFIGLCHYYINYSPSSDNIFNDINANISIKVIYLYEGNIERLLSGRLGLYELAIENFINNPLLGSYYGVVFKGIANFKAHNLFLEALSSYGILGFITFIIPLLTALFNVNRINRRIVESETPFLLALLVGIIHGFVEPNFFTLSFEFIWWSIAGYAIGKYATTEK